MDYLIRSLRNDDISDVQFIARESWHHTYAGIIPEDIQENFLGQAYSEETMKQRIEQSHFFVAEVKGHIAGFANFSYSKEKNEMELMAIYILLHYQRHGMGTALVEAGLRSNTNVKRVVVDVETENKKGKNFYLSQGFVITGEFVDMFEDYPLHTTRMMRWIKQ